MVKELTIISGKGGCGKTTIAAAFTSLAKNIVIADADVDAADMHLLLQPEIISSEGYFGLDIAVKDEDACINCGKCYQNCRYGAFDADNTYHSDKCEGCAVCELVCPVGAMKMVPRESGLLYNSKTRFGPMVHARLHPGEEASGKLVAMVRKRAKEVADEQKKDTIIIDGPPGIGCTVIAALTGVDLVLVVIEPTLAGIHDSKRIIEVARHFKIPALVCINKHDINPDNTQDIIDYCKDENLEVAGMIAYDDTATQAMMAGKNVIEYSDSTLAKSIKDIWEKVDRRLHG